MSLLPLLRPVLYSRKHGGCLCLDPVHRDSDHHDVVGSLWYIPSLMLFPNLTGIILFLFEHVPFPLLFVRGVQNLYVDFWYLPTDLIDLQSHSDALLERGF